MYFMGPTLDAAAKQASVPLTPNPGLAPIRPHQPSTHASSQMADDHQHTSTAVSMGDSKGQDQQPKPGSVGSHPNTPGGSKGPWNTADSTSTVMQGFSLVGAVSKEPRLRFWVDQVLWSIGYPAVQLIEEVLVHAGGQRTGGPQGRLSPQEQRDGSCLGCHHPSQWDLLWTKSTYALKAVRSLRPGQCVSMIVGLNSLTMKKRMLLTLKAAYGPEAAAQLTPLSFALPEELPHWKAWLKQHARLHKHADKQLWMLKTGQDAGKGLSLLSARDALAAAEREAGNRQQEDKQTFQLQIAQVYLTNPLLLEGRKFHIRLWLVVTQHEPLQAYLHSRGLVLFSSEPYDPLTPWATLDKPSKPSACRGQQAAIKTTPLLLTHATPLEADLAELSLSEPDLKTQARRSSKDGQGMQPEAVQQAAGPVQGSGTRISPGHITNLARNSSGLVWQLKRLEQALGSQAYGKLWHAMQRSLRLTLNAARDPLAEAHKWLSPPFPAYGFQLLGVDFMVDTGLRPWLLEFNSSPSIMTLHDDPDTAAMIYQEKHQMLSDMFNLVAHRVYPPDSAPPATGQSEAAPPLGEFISLFSSTASPSDTEAA